MKLFCKMGKFELNLTEKIKHLCDTRGITIKELAEKIGVSFSGLYVAMKKDSIKLDVLMKISEELDVEPEYFFQDDLEKSIKDTTTKSAKKSIEKELINWCYAEFADLWHLKFRMIQSSLLTFLTKNPKLAYELTKDENFDTFITYINNVFETSDIPLLIKTLNNYYKGEINSITHKEIVAMINKYHENKEKSGPFSIPAIDIDLALKSGESKKITPENKKI